MQSVTELNSELKIITTDMQFNIKTMHYKYFLAIHLFSLELTPIEVFPTISNAMNKDELR